MPRYISSNLSASSSKPSAIFFDFFAHGFASVTYPSRLFARGLGTPNVAANSAGNGAVDIKSGWLAIEDADDGLDGTDKSNEDDVSTRRRVEDSTTSVFGVETDGAANKYKSADGTVTVTDRMGDSVTAVCISGCRRNRC